MLIHKKETVIELKYFTAMFVLAASLLAFGSPVQALTWGTPVAIAASTVDPTILQNYMNPSEDIDADGNLVAAWVEISSAGVRKVWSRSRNAGVWSSKVQLDVASTESYAPQVEVTSSGNATAVWSTAAGVWSADRPKGKGWQKPVMLIPGFTGTPLFSMNNRGDALLTYQLDTTAVMAMRRTAENAWKQPEVMALAQPYIDAPLGAVMSDNGDALVSWISFTRHPHGYIASQMLHVSRAVKGSVVWQDSGILAGVSGTLTYYKPALLADAQGRAGILYYDYATDNIVSSTQVSAGQAWTLPTFVTYGCSICWPSLSFDGAHNDAAGNVTLIVNRGEVDIFTDIATYDMISVTGKLATNTWNPETLVPGVFNNPIYYGAWQGFDVQFNVGANGDLLVLWHKYNYDLATAETLLSDPIVNKSRIGNVWGATTRFPGQVGDIKINANGKTAVFYQRSAVTASGSTRFVLYAINSI